ncbi:response regulator [candidate division KSB1 bacterium]|nr:response regulator [candidate division KSB1 bacterium]
MKAGLRIIIVDKDEKQADTIARQLKQAKMLQSWQRVSNAKEFSLALEQKPDLIIANYFLPNFSAREVLSALENNNAEIPCIVMTNNGDSESAVECLKAGAFDYISNIHLFRLPEAVREALGKPTSTAQQQLRNEQTFAKPLDQLEKLAAFGRLAGGVVHDFNNLLTVINGYCELLSIALKTDDPANAYVEQILKTCDRGATLSKQLLGFSRRMPIKHTVFDLNALVADMATMLQRILRENIELMVHQQPEPVHISADAAEIEQIIVNLAVNARDAMPKGGRLLIETKKMTYKKPMQTPFVDMPPGNYVMLIIHDSGTGMSESVKKKLFTPFFTTKLHGTGLGLATVQNYVRRCNGFIDFQSELHKGTLFKIHFPETTAPIDIEGTNEDVEILPRGSETVLVVEDEPEVRRITLRLLQMQGYHVLDAQHGDDARLMCEKFHKDIDLLITDMMLPDITGPELSARLKKFRPKMKVLYISGYSNAAELQTKAGGENIQKALLQKPFTVDALARKVREILDR